MVEDAKPVNKTRLLLGNDTGRRVNVEWPGKPEYPRFVEPWVWVTLELEVGGSVMFKPVGSVSTYCM